MYVRFIRDKIEIVGCMYSSYHDRESWSGYCNYAESFSCRSCPLDKYKLSLPASQNFKEFKITESKHVLFITETEI